MLIAVCTLVGLTGQAGAESTAAATLAETYSPALMIEAQTEPCGPGEAYRPTVVNIVLDNSEVVLRNSGGEIVKRGPTAHDLSGAPGSDYIDLPGNPLSPGCGYEKQFQRWFGDRMPTLYARVATDSEHPGKLVVQYWSFYTFNDFTNKHEGDWEMVQVDFAAATPEEALKAGPYEVDLAQHAGGERAAWNDDPKLSKVGTHPVSYVSTGSHSEYFQDRLYLGTGGSAIFGCEDTRANTTQLQPQTVVLPQTPVPADSPFAWLNFAGRWGQKQAGINNGPLGPAYAGSWEHPITWAEGLRTSSLTVPRATILGLSVTSFFCGAVDNVSVALNWGLIHPALFLGLLGVILFAGAVTARRTTWRPPDPRPVRGPRGGGQILRSSLRLYGNHVRTFVGIGAIFIPISVVAAVVQWLVFHLTPLDKFVALDGPGGSGTVLLSLIIGGIGGIIAAAAVTAAVASALSELDAGRPVSAIDAYRAAARHWRALFGATAIQVVLTAILTLSVIGIPYAVYRLIRTSLFAQTCALEDETATGSLRASAVLIRGRWWRTFGFTVMVDLVAALSGPLLGVLVLLLTSRSLTFIDITGSIIYALTVPYAAIALTLYYFDLHARAPSPASRASRRQRTVASPVTET